jgi:4-amino-4-deoxy-L-arabinose transferase-like glycosyltransferase
MPPKLPRAAWLAVPLAGLLYFYRLGAAGLVGPDEPRYASIGREMARSGDWITPRLWGQPWFEKPALLYWMEALAFRLGLGPEMAPRLPVATLAVAFLAFYWWILRREFGGRAAGMATLILGTSGAWIVASQIGVTDLPLAATFSAAMLLALPWIARRDSALLPLAAALLGLAVLAKGLVPAVLAFPLFWRGAAWRDLFRPRVALPFLAVCLPWYVLCYLRNGRPFLVEFFWQHHFERMVSPALMHVQPWWFYLPVLLASLLPWTPLLVLLGGRAAYRDSRRIFLLAWLLFGLAFFSVATNKLPGYLLPLLPAAAALMGLALAEAAGARGWLALSAGLLVIFPMAVPILPAAVADGLSRAPRPAFDWTWLLPAGLAAVVWALDMRSRRMAAVLAIAAGAVAGIVYVKYAAMPALDRTASARSLWREVENRAALTCAARINRNWRYGLNYYSVDPLPECSEDPRPWWIRQVSGERPSVDPAPPPTAPPDHRLTPSHAAL